MRNPIWFLLCLATAGCKLEGPVPDEQEFQDFHEARSHELVVPDAPAPLVGLYGLEGARICQGLRDRVLEIQSAIPLKSGTPGFAFQVDIQNERTSYRAYFNPGEVAANDASFAFCSSMGTRLSSRMCHVIGVSRGGCFKVRLWPAATGEDFHAALVAAKEGR